jgi:hypothetical protein
VQRADKIGPVINYFFCLCDRRPTLYQLYVNSMSTLWLKSFSCYQNSVNV